MRVLLIDDDARLAELLDDNLRPQGVVLVHAGGGQAGLAQLAGGGFDAILLDVMMPGMDGPTTLGRIRTHPQLAHIPVAFMTAKAMPQEVARFRQLGAAGIIAKPFDPMRLSADIAGIWTRATAGG